MDYPEGARVLNISVDLGVHGRDDHPIPPIETRVRVIAEPLLRLTSIDLDACKDVTDARRAVQLRQRLPRAGQGRGDRLGPGARLARRDLGEAGRIAWLGRPALGWAWRSSARSTTSPRGRGWRSPRTCWPRDLRLMRATGQARNLTGPLGPRGGPGRGRPGDPGRVAGRIGRRLAGFGRRLPRESRSSRGVAAVEGDPESGISRGRLLPDARDPRSQAGRRPRGRPRPSSTGPWPRAWSWSTAGWPRTSGRS